MVLDVVVVEAMNEVLMSQQQQEDGDKTEEGNSVNSDSRDDEHMKTVPGHGGQGQGSHRHGRE